MKWSEHLGDAYAKGHQAGRTEGIVAAVVVAVVMEGLRHVPWEKAMDALTLKIDTFLARRK